MLLGRKKIHHGPFKKKHLTAVLFELQNSYYMTFGILKDLYELGLKGRLTQLIETFLEDRIFQVLIGTTPSDLQNQTESVPQGSILLMTLF